MRGVVVHAPKDLRIETVADQPLGSTDVEVRIEAGGICGSDLHYYNHGGTGTIRLRQPMVLGHEIAGTVTRVGAEVSAVAVGTRVAVNPSRACGQCRACREGLHNHCRDMRFLGSAMCFPTSRAAFARAWWSVRRRRCRSPLRCRWPRRPWPSRWRSACMPCSAPAR
ncbi:L-idonate 5-dehydrogenase [Labrys wisconsinensis]|uniref:L-idonate 5-dehydrogenase n=1 Tax=Labrys wisconsinensis TaxID=425677 RepID=A0ABU0JLL3_9HYPH|nr:L-idonate 5-dehydrogenase [Labrys wisconsinensis]